MSDSMMQQQAFRPRKNPQAEIEAALQKAIKLATGEKQYTIADGYLVYGEHHRYRYAFTLKSSWDVPDDTDLYLSSSDFDHLLSVQLIPRWFSW